jgi:zinc finger protein
VKSEYATARFEELDFEIPPDSQKGVLSTIDGMLDRAIEGLKQDQAARLLQHPELHAQIEDVISRLQGYYDKAEPFTFSIDDPTGNSNIENLCAPNPDPKLTTRIYKRSKEQNERLGLVEEEDELPLEQQVHVFPGNCSRCNAPSETRMHMLGNC